MVSLSREEQKSTVISLAALLLMAAGVGIASLFSLSDAELTRLHDIAETVAGFSAFLFTLLGYISAAWWWWHRDPRRPRINVGKQVSAFALDSGEHVLEIVLSVQNVGEVPVDITEWEIYAFQVWPPPEGRIEMLRDADGYTIRREDTLEDEADAGKVFRTFAHLAERVRPGEIQEFAATMLIRRGIQAVRLEAQIPHGRLRYHEKEVRAWMKFTVIDFRSLQIVGKGQG